MRWVQILLAFSLLLAGCQPLQAPPSQVFVTPSLVPTSQPTVQATLPATLSPTIEPTATQTPVLCEPSQTEYCIEDGHFIFERPIGLDDNPYIDGTYRYASTQGGNREAHHGVELVNASGTPVLAAADGLVVFAGNDSQVATVDILNFYGNYVILKHQTEYGELFTLYAHLSALSVQTGQTIVAGQEIGLVGATGAAIGSHLHFEVRVTNGYDGTRNPALWLKPLNGTGVLAGTIFDRNNPLIKGSVRIQRMENGKISEQVPPQPMDIYPLEMESLSDGENFAIGDLAAGEYRLTFLYNGSVYERFVIIETGKLTRVEIELQ